MTAPTLKWVASLARLCQVAALAWKHVKRAHGFRPNAMGGAS